MNNQRKTEIKVGITVLVGIIIFLWVLGWAKNFTINSNRKIINVEFSSVGGLEIGDPAEINGVRKGYIDDIRIKGSNVLVVLNMDTDVNLKNNAEFSIMMLDLMGGKKVEINPGTGNVELNYSEEQKGKLLGDVSSAMAMLGNVQQDLVEVIKEVKTSLTYINKTFADKEFESNLKTSVKNLSFLTHNLNQVLSENKEQVNKLLVSGNKLTESINSFVADNKDTISQTISSLKETLEESKVMIAKINNFMEKVDKGDNNLGKALNDDELIDNLKTTIKNLKELSNILLEQLKNKGLKVDADVDLF